MINTSTNHIIQKMGDYFILTIVSFSAAIFIATIKICFASKCQSIDFCFGLLRVDRSVNLESQQISSNLTLDVVRQTQNEKKMLQTVPSFDSPL